MPSDDVTSDAVASDDVTGDRTDQGEGLSGLAHSQSSAEVIARYDEWAETYEQDLASWGYVVPQTLAAQLQQKLDSAGLGGPVLDAGCGTGLVGRALATEGIGPIVGIDASKESLSVAGAAGVYESVLYADLGKPLVFEDDHFSGSVCGGVLTYLADTEAVLGELARVTKPGGVVLASQRTDLWVSRDCEAVLQKLSARGDLDVNWSEPQTYLPGHPEYADEIKVRYITISILGVS